MNTGLGGMANIFGILVSLILLAAVLVWVERRLLAVWQDRLGPNRLGPFGLMQVAADMIKMFFKEDWIPPFADKAVFLLAPTIVFITTLMAFAVIRVFDTGRDGEFLKFNDTLRHVETVGLPVVADRFQTFGDLAGLLLALSESTSTDSALPPHKLEGWVLRQGDLIGKIRVDDLKKIQNT